MLECDSNSIQFYFASTPEGLVQIWMVEEREKEGEGWLSVMVSLSADSSGLITLTLTLALLACCHARSVYCQRHLPQSVC